MNVLPVAKVVVVVCMNFYVLSSNTFCEPVDAENKFESYMIAQLRDLLEENLHLKMAKKNHKRVSAPFELK